MRNARKKRGLLYETALHIWVFFLFILISKGLLCSMFVVGAPFDTNPSLSFRGSRGEENRRDIFPLMWLVNYSTYYILSLLRLFCWLMIHFLWDWEVIGSFMIKQKKNSVAWRFLLQNLWVRVMKIMFLNVRWLCMLSFIFLCWHLVGKIVNFGLRSGIIRVR